jgi:hypothetical protein
MRARTIIFVRFENEPGMRETEPKVVNLFERGVDPG